MDEEIRKQIEEIIGKMQCPKDFICAKSGFTRLCKAKDIGLATFLECLECNPAECNFALSFNSVYYCSCPLRVYLSRKFDR